MTNAQADKGYDRLPTIRARELRNNSTDAERARWRAIRNRQIGGVRFNRQVPIGPYICDLVARSERLVIEGDGGQHAIDAGKDRRRTCFIESQGHRVVRYWDHEVLNNLDGLVAEIAAVLTDRPSPDPSRRRERD